MSEERFLIYIENVGNKDIFKKGKFSNPPTLEEPRVGRTYFLLALCLVDAYLNSKNKRRRNVNMAVIVLLAIAVALVKLYVEHHVS